MNRNRRAVPDGAESPFFALKGLSILVKKVIIHSAYSLSAVLVGVCRRDVIPIVPVLFREWYPEEKSTQNPSILIPRPHLRGSVSTSEVKRFSSDIRIRTKATEYIGSRYRYRLLLNLKKFFSWTGSGFSLACVDDFF